MIFVLLLISNYCLLKSSSRIKNEKQCFKLYLVFTAGLAILGLALLALAGFLLLNKSAGMQALSPGGENFSPYASENALLLGKLAFERRDLPSLGTAKVSLLAVNGDGTDMVPLAIAGTPPLFCGEASYSSDGSQIVYVQDQDIYVMNADGSNKINITNNNFGAVERNPSWSATGKIAYERDSQIWTMNANGTNQAQFSAITQPSPIAPAWSPDGSKLAFASGGDIWVINADGTNERRVTNNTTTDADPAWSPDGAKIIFGKGD